MLVSALVGLLGGCAKLQYMGQAVVGHGSIIVGSRPVERILRAPETEPVLARQLGQANAILAFAHRELSLPDNGSYRRYTRTGREHVVWNVIAAPKDSVNAIEHCFPVTGCVAYLGFYREIQARRAAEKLRHRGFDVFVAGVDAYSTLGWFRDPLLDTFLDYPLADLAGLLFHELSHQILYVPGDTVFNESFATVVEHAGVRKFLKSRGSSALFEAYTVRRQKLRDFIALIAETKKHLATHYASVTDSGLLIRGKKRILDRLYGNMRQRFPNFGVSRSSTADQAAELNNAFLAAYSLYYEFEPAFSRLLRENNDDFEEFYLDVDRLSKLAASERHARLRTLMDEAAQK